jgi:putative addiction module component (TIGR02574 family)
MTVAQIKTELVGLSQDERAELAYFLLTSLEPEDPGAAAAWDEEIARRADEVRNETAEGVPAEVVFAELRERYR